MVSKSETKSHELFLFILLMILIMVNSDDGATQEFVRLFLLAHSKWSEITGGRQFAIITLADQSANCLWEFVDCL